MSGPTPEHSRIAMRLDDLEDCESVAHLEIEHLLDWYIQDVTYLREENDALRERIKELEPR